MQSAASNAGTSRSTPISAVVITKNEEGRIDACLRALAGWVDEIVVVDSGSDDRTVEIARRYPCTVIETHWRGYGKQKQFAVDAATHDWVLSVDADEIVTPALRDEIDRRMDGDPAEVAFRIPREYVVFGHTLRHGNCGRAPVRLFRRDRARFSADEVHEKVLADGRIGRLRARLVHASIRDMAHSLDKSNEYAALWAMQRHRRGRRVGLLACCAHAAWGFFQVYVARRGWLDGRRGLVLAVLHAEYAFNKYVTLWSLGLDAVGRGAAPGRPRPLRDSGSRDRPDDGILRPAPRENQGRRTG